MGEDIGGMDEAGVVALLVVSNFVAWREWQLT
jgi:hypothetical protein